MIDPVIKERLGLKANAQAGVSFITNSEVCEYPEFTTEEVKAYILDCDLQGEPLTKGRLMFYAKTNTHYRTALFPVEFTTDLAFFRDWANRFIIDKLQNNAAL